MSRPGGRGTRGGGDVIVKVCGVRTPEIAEVAVESGADWLGLVFEPRSPRCLDVASAQTIAAAVRGRAQLVGVLVEPTSAACDELAQRCGLAAVQVHGNVDPELATSASVPVIRGLNVRDLGDAVGARWWPDLLLLVDAAADASELPGGTGRRLDLGLAAAVAQHRRIILAGGLDADSVASSIAAVRPAGVDASSGLESAPGVKDPARVEGYVRAARRAFAEQPAHV